MGLKDELRLAKVRTRAHDFVRLLTGVDLADIYADLCSVIDAAGGSSTPIKTTWTEFKSMVSNGVYQPNTAYWMEDAPMGGSGNAVIFFRTSTMNGVPEISFEGWSGNVGSSCKFTGQFNINEDNSISDQYPYAYIKDVYKNNVFEKPNLANDDNSLYPLLASLNYSRPEGWDWLNATVKQGYISPDTTIPNSVRNWIFGAGNHAFGGSNITLTNGETAPTSGTHNFPDGITVSNGTVGGIRPTAYCELDMGNVAQIDFRLNPLCGKIKIINAPVVDDAYTIDGIIAYKESFGAEITLLFGNDPFNLTGSIYNGPFLPNYGVMAKLILISSTYPYPDEIREAVLIAPW